MKKQKYRNLLETVIFIRNLNLKTKMTPKNWGIIWNKYCNGEFKELPPKPKDIPDKPWEHYEDKEWEYLIKANRYGKTKKSQNKK